MSNMEDRCRESKRVIPKRGLIKSRLQQWLSIQCFLFSQDLLHITTPRDECN
ncbi:hypothetical protein HanRHA438_Chr06g0250061 [Helianthus annuus]|nr:hypothetical protein HanRHA438_Chr06g0250061 [Helianthus annuus]